MKIAFLVHGFPGLSETFILNQIVGLMDLGHEVEIFAQHDYGEDVVHPQVSDHGLMQRLVYVPRGKLDRLLKTILTLGRRLNDPENAFSALRGCFKWGEVGRSLIPSYLFLRLLGKRFDILHCHYGVNGNIGVCLKLMGLPSKIVTMFHGYDVKLGVATAGRIYKRLFEHGNCFLANSEDTYRKIVRMGAPPEKTIVHPVGIGLKHFPFRRHVNAERGSQRIILVTVARLVEEKGIEYAIAAVKRVVERMPGLELEYRIIGEGPLRDELKKIAVALGLGKVVRFLGGLTQRDVVQNLAESDIFVLPSISEGLGVALMEAHAVGLPVLASSVGGIPEVVRDGISGLLIPPGNVAKLADGLAYLADHREIWQSMGEKGRGWVEKKYDIEKLNRRLVDIYKSLH